MISGLWLQVRAGKLPAVAAVRVCERRARLPGPDAPVTMKSELTGSLGVYAERLPPPSASCSPQSVCLLAPYCWQTHSTTLQASLFRKRPNGDVEHTASEWANVPPTEKRP